MSTHTFDEFQSIRKRQRGTEEKTRSTMGKEEKIGQKLKPVRGANGMVGELKESPVDSTGLARRGKRSSDPLTYREQIGLVAENNATQVMIAIMVATDILSVLAQILFREHMGTQTVTLLDTQAYVFLILFTLELTLLFVAFGFNMFSHIGYTTDTIIVFSSFYCQVFMNLPGVRLFGVLRMWRVGRILQNIITDIEDQHEITRQELKRVRKRLENAVRQRNSVADNLKRTREEKSRTIEMLQSYKDEVAYLKEALQIAAEKVAEVEGLATMMEAMDEDGSLGGPPAPMSSLPGTSGGKTRQPPPSGGRLVIHSDGSVHRH